MRIALVAPLVSPISDEGVALGGAQSFLADLAIGLAQRGHQVTLLAAPGSGLPGVTTPALALSSDELRAATFGSDAERSDEAAQAAAFGVVRNWLRANTDEIDVVHAHAYDAPAFDLLRGLGPPVVHTVHLPPLHADVVRSVRAAAGEATLVTVSEANAEAWRASDATIHAVIPNGIDVDSVPFGASHRDYLLFAGRITPEKGPDTAIRAAEAAAWPLLLVGGAYDQQFQDDAILPIADWLPEWRLGDSLKSGAALTGPRPRAELLQLMSRAAALLLPVRWGEPFGLVAAEALAAGCPVIAYARGGLVEVVEDSRTGFLVDPDDEAGLVAAIGRLGEIDRAACRERIVARYSLGHMLDEYEQLYAHLVAA